MDNTLPQSTNQFGHFPELDFELVDLPLEYDRTAKEILEVLVEQLAVSKNAVSYLNAERESRESSPTLARFQQNEQDQLRVQTYTALAGQSRGLGALDGTLFLHCIQVLKDPEIFPVLSDSITLLKNGYFEFGREAVERRYLQPLVADRLGNIAVALGAAVNTSAETSGVHANQKAIEYRDWEKALPDEILSCVYTEMAGIAKNAPGLYFDFACSDYPSEVQDARSLLVLRTTGLARDALSSIATLAWQNRAETLLHVLPQVHRTMQGIFNSNYSEIVQYCVSPEADNEFAAGFIRNFSRTLEHLRRLTESPLCASNEQIAEAAQSLKTLLTPAANLFVTTLGCVPEKSSHLLSTAESLREEVKLLEGNPL